MQCLHCILCHKSIAEEEPLGLCGFAMDALAFGLYNLRLRFSTDS